MRKDQIFVLLLVILLPLTGCFGGGGLGEVEGSDETGEETETGSDETGEETETDSTDSDSSEGVSANSQLRTWYSSGGIYQSYWNDGQFPYEEDNGSQVYISNQGERCLDYGPYYDSSTGELIGERCNEFGTPNSASDWDLSNCTDRGGEIVWSGDVVENPAYYSYAPTCRISFTTINLSAGEALIIYEWSNFYMLSTCDNVETTTYGSSISGKEYFIVPGSAMECSHELFLLISYTYSENNFERQSMWSVVYAIQDTTVV